MANMYSEMGAFLQEAFNMDRTVAKAHRKQSLKEEAMYTFDSPREGVDEYGYTIKPLGKASADAEYVKQYDVNGQIYTASISSVWSSDDELEHYYTLTDEAGQVIIRGNIEGYTSYEESIKVIEDKIEELVSLGSRKMGESLSTRKNKKLNESVESEDWEGRALEILRNYDLDYLLGFLGKWYDLDDEETIQPIIEDHPEEEIVWRLKQEGELEDFVREEEALTDEF